MKNFKQRTIILTDDDEDDRDFFQYAIDDLGIDCNLLLFSSGKQLIDYLDDNPIPDIVFLDLNMPVMSGFQSLEKIRADERFRKIPVITIYSTSSNDADKKKSLQLGANAYITKPNDFSDLKNLMNKVLVTDWENETSPITMETFVIR